MKTIYNPIWIAVQATGNLKKYQLYDNSLQFLVLPTCYVMLKYFSLPPYVVYVVVIFYDLILIPVRAYIVFPMIQYSKLRYLKEVMSPIIKVTMASVLLSYLSYIFIQKTFMGNVLLFFSIFFISTTVVWLLGLNAKERHVIWSKVVSVKNNLKWIRK